MTYRDITYRNFERDIIASDYFETTETWNNLILLIGKWNKYVEENTSKKRLKISEISSGSFHDIKLINIDLGNIVIPTGQEMIFLYLDNSVVDNIKIEDRQYTLQRITVEWSIKKELTSRIKKLQFDNFHFSNEQSTTMHIVNLKIDNFYFSRTINSSEKIQIFWCAIQKLIVSWSDLWRMLFIKNVIKNLYCSWVLIFNTVLLSSRIWKVHKRIKWIEGFPSNITLEDIMMADINRQLKISYDNSKEYLQANRFYRDEMMYTLKDKKFFSPFLLLHLITSYFWTSWILALFFIMILGLWRLLVESPEVFQDFCLSFEYLIYILNSSIDNINPYLNLEDAKDGVSIFHLLYLLLLSYGVYQFVLSVRRISKR